MQKNEVCFTQDIYSEHLSAINGVNFTPREIDVISCLLSARRTNQIASILSIAPRTVTTHFRNIMLRIDCNSQEGIINFIEKSSKLSVLRSYYSSLMVSTAFEKSLKEISRLKRQELPTCLIIYWQDCNLKNALLQYMGSHLAQMGISTEIRDQGLDKNVEKKENSSQILLLLREKREPENTLQEFSRFEFVDLSEEQNYYFSVFNILKKLLINVNLDTIFINFKNQYEGMHSPSKEKPFKNYEEENKKNFIYKIVHIVKTRKWFFLSGVSIVCLFGICFFATKGGNNHTETLSQKHFVIKENTEESSIRSDLVIPTETSLLHQPELIAQIDDQLKSQHGIQTVAFTGPEGAEKIAIARQYAAQQKSNTIWEINAETHENLKTSFESLAHTLTKTEEDKKILKELQSIQDVLEKEEKTIKFVKERLKLSSNWLLLYNNLKEFSALQKYLPQDSTSWGQGKVIIISQKNNIKYNIYFKDIKIINLEKLDSKKNANNKETTLKIHNILFKKYLKKLSEQMQPHFRIFIAYSGSDQHKKQVEDLASDLVLSGFPVENIWLDVWVNRPGSGVSFSKHSNNILEADKILLIGSPQLKTRYNLKKGMITYEINLLRDRIKHKGAEGIIPVLFEGDPKDSLPEEIQNIQVHLLSEDYFVGFFNLLINLHQLNPIDNYILSIRNDFIRQRNIPEDVLEKYNKKLLEDQKEQAEENKKEIEILLDGS